MDENLGGGSGFHLVSSIAGEKLAPVATDKLAGHQLKVTAYGNSRAGQNVQLFINDVAITSPVRPRSDSFVFDAIVVIDATSDKVLVQVDSPLTDTNVRQVVTQFAPLPETIVFELKGTSEVHGFQLWKLGLRD
jgi:hypothetical protein